MKVDCIATKVMDYLIHYELILYMWAVQVKFKLCHMTQVLLIKIEVYSNGKTHRLLKLSFLHLQMCRYITTN